MRNKLPKNGPRVNESAVVNLDDAQGPGTHWVGYKKRGHVIQYFDSFGDLQPPTELTSYWCKSDSRAQIIYNSNRYQEPEAWNCGHLVLDFLRQ